MLHEDKALLTQGGYQVIIILPIKSKMAAARKRYLAVLFAISCILLNLYLHHSKGEVYK